MSDSLDCLLTELEELSAKALAEAGSGDLTGATETLGSRGVAIGRLSDTLAAAQVSYEEWNRLAVIHFQGNRVQKLLEDARAGLLTELIGIARDEALLHCMAGVATDTPPASINEMA